MIMSTYLNPIRSSGANTSISLSTTNTNTRTTSIGATDTPEVDISDRTIDVQAIREWNEVISFQSCISLQSIRHRMGDLSLGLEFHNLIEIFERRAAEIDHFTRERIHAARVAYIYAYPAMWACDPPAAIVSRVSRELSTMTGLVRGGQIPAFRWETVGDASMRATITVSVRSTTFVDDLDEDAMAIATVASVNDYTRDLRPTYEVPPEMLHDEEVHEPYLGIERTPEPIVRRQHHERTDRPVPLAPPNPNLPRYKSR